MLQYKIPQDVGVEDKIVGPLSLRQLIIVAVGVGISYVIYAISAKLYELNVLEYIVIALPALIALAAAFIRINNVSFTKFVLLFLEFAIKPKKRLWDHRGIAHLVAPDLKEKKTGTAAAVAEGKKRKDVDLDELSRILDSGGFENVKVAKHEDIDKAKDEDLVAEAYFGHKKTESPTENMYWRTKESHKKRLEMLAKLPVTKKQEGKVEEAVKTGQQTKSQAGPTSVEQAHGARATAPREAAPQPQASPTPKAAPQPVREVPAVKPQVQPKPEINKITQPVQPSVQPPVTAVPISKQADKSQPVQKPVQPPATTMPIGKPADKPVQPPVQQPVRPSVPQSARPAGGSGRQSDVQPAQPANPAVVERKPAETVPAPKTQTVAPAPGTAKKKRHRNKKPKTLMPVRPETQINNTQKNKPVTLIPKEKTETKPDIRQEQQVKKVKNGQGPRPGKQEQPVPKEKPAQKDQTGGEIHLEELKKGEITWGF